MTSAFLTASCHLKPLNTGVVQDTYDSEQPAEILQDIALVSSNHSNPMAAGPLHPVCHFLRCVQSKLCEDIQTHEGYDTCVKCDLHVAWCPSAD